MAIDGIMFKDGSVRATRLGENNIQRLSLSLLSKGGNNKSLMLMHIERGSSYHIYLEIMHIERGRNL
jgi:hypothetical protein